MTAADRIKFENLLKEAVTAQSYVKASALIAEAYAMAVHAAQTKTPASTGV